MFPQLIQGGIPALYEVLNVEIGERTNVVFALGTIRRV